MIGRFGQQNESGRLEPGVHLIESAFDGRRRRIDARMRNDGEKLVNARPGYRPRCVSLGELRDYAHRPFVKRRVFPMGGDEDVRVDRNQAPRPS